MTNFSDAKTSNLKKINKIFIYILFILVFTISFFLAIPQTKNNKTFTLVWFISSMCCLFVFAIVWIIIYCYFKKKNLTSNNLKIKKIIENNKS